MDSRSWLAILIPLIAGGAMGTILTALISSYRNRIQPVGRRISVTRVFRDTLGASSLRTRINISQRKKSYAFRNLFLVDVRLRNRGNKDIDNFIIGFNLASGDRAIYVEPTTPDRFHQIVQHTQVSLSSPVGELDFTFSPFNRKDVYSLKLFIVVPNDHSEPGDITLASPQPVHFVDLDLSYSLASKIFSDLMGATIAVADVPGTTDRFTVK